MKLIELKEIKPFPKTSGPQGGSIFRGVTLQAGDPKHTHRFEIKFGRNGKLISGRTLSDDSGHSHQISSVGRTESAQGHSHPLPIQSGGRSFHGGGGRTPPGGPGSMTGGGTGGGGMTGTGAGTGTPGTGDPGGGGGGNGGGM
jgi:hypothetical protein